MKIVVIRSAKFSQFYTCCQHLRDQYAHAEFTVITQEEAKLPEDFFPEGAVKYVFCSIGPMSTAGLKLLNLPPYELYDMAVIPLNNDSGDGYHEIFSYFAEFPTVAVWTTKGKLIRLLPNEKFWLSHPVWREGVDLIISFPFILASVVTILVFVPLSNIVRTLTKFRVK